MTKKMNKIEKLIAELCPDGVEFKELGVCLQRTKGTPITAQKMSEINKEGAPIKIFAGGKTVAYVNYGDIPEKDVLSKESVVVKSRGIIGFEYINKPFSHKNEFWSYHSNNPNIDIKYVYYYLKSKESYFQSVGQRMSKMPQLSIPDTDKFKIPIPPLAIQQEIVKILDTFTELEAELEVELEVELEARKKQYEHYRTELLTFNERERERVRWATLSQIGKIVRGTAITAKETTEGNIPVVANAPKPIYFHGKSNRSGETIVIARSGAYAGLVSFWNEPIFLTDAFSVHVEDTLLKTKFVYYLLKQKQEAIHFMKRGSGVPHVRAKEFESYRIPIPPIAEQERIVAILDKFDALVNDISVGLPAEISARRKQYEYYRDQLLTFKPLEMQNAN